MYGMDVELLLTTLNGCAGFKVRLVSHREFFLQALLLKLLLNGHNLQEPVGYVRV